MIYKATIPSSATFTAQYRRFDISSAYHDPVLSGTSTFTAEYKRFDASLIYEAMMLSGATCTDATSGNRHSELSCSK